MAFSFGSGNARKLLRLPLYVAGRVLTAVVPRSADQWVFGSAAGVSDGALALWNRAAADARPATWLAASAREEAEARGRGMRVVRRDSLAGLWRTARARVVVVTHGQGDANRYAVHGSFLVQLWHGVPLKRLGLDAPETMRAGGDGAVGRMLRPLVTAAYRRTQRGIRLLPAASPIVRGRLESAFGLPPGRVRVTGEPRADVLSEGEASARRRAAAGRLRGLLGAPPAPDTRIVLYAPTWRDGAIDPAVPTAAEWAAITRLLDEHDALLLIRSHPLGAGDYAPPAPHARVRALGADLAPDVGPLLAALDVLVTDYSSLGVDAGLLALPVVWFAPDAIEYERARGFYGRYDDVAGGAAGTWGETLERLGAILGDPDARDAASRRSRAVSEALHAFRDGGNTERVYRDIERGAGLGAPATRGPA